MTTRKPILAVALMVVIGALLAGCGGSGEPSVPASSKLVPVHGNPAGKIVLTAAGAQHLGLQTATVRSVRAPAAAKAIIPFAAVVYAPSGQTYAFISQGRLTFTEVPITIDRINGDAVYLLKGPQAGSKVVTVGAEELFGVQTGVLDQT
jgi:multidrug efflux pump subunit AcrA (membrane-fusion protein)